MQLVWTPVYHHMSIQLHKKPMMVLAVLETSRFLSRKICCTVLASTTDYIAKKKKKKKKQNQLVTYFYY